MTREEKKEVALRNLTLDSLELAGKIAREPRAVGRAIVQCNVKRRDELRAERSAAIEQQIRKIGIWN